MKKEEIQALITLLDDPDTFVFNEIKLKLIECGIPVIEVLEGAWETDFDPLRQKRIENIVHEIQYNHLSVKLLEWAKLGGQSLLTGALLVCKYQFPDLDEQEVKDRIERIRKDIWLELNEELTALETVRVINQILFNTHGFIGNKEDYHAPQNSFINKVLERKKGNPLSLSLLYIILSESLDLPIYGVNLPDHFVLAYKDKYGVLDPAGISEHHNVLFYINPFSKGSVFGKKEIDSFLKQLKLSPKNSYYEPCKNVEMIIRMLNNLYHSYVAINKKEKAEDIKKIMEIMIANI